VVEGFHIEGNQDSVARREPHVIPLRNCRPCEPAVSEPAALVNPGKVRTCAHGPANPKIRVVVQLPCSSAEHGLSDFIGRCDAVVESIELMFGRDVECLCLARVTGSMRLCGRAACVIEDFSLPVWQALA
jgi:hypothetical protein